jgi:hypothetical protein
MSFLRPLVSFIGVFQRLFGMLLPGLVIFFPVVCGSRTVRMCCEFVEFCGSLVRVVWQGLFLSVNCILEPLHFPISPLVDTYGRVAKRFDEVFATEIGVQK